MSVAAACNGLVAHAQTFRTTPTLSLDETFTTNANLQPPGQEISDFVTQITPGVSISTSTAHTSLNGFINVPMFIYAKETQNNKVLPYVNLVGSANTSDRRVGVDAAVYVTQEFANAFGARPSNVSADTPNRYTQSTYVITPHAEGSFSGTTHYSVRDTNTWTRISNAPFSANNNVFTSDAAGTLSRDPLPFGYGVDLQHTIVKFVTQDALSSDLARLRGIWQADPQLQLFASAGYESNDYSVQTFNNTIYGAGGSWHPSPRASLSGSWEHRFFGSSYSVAGDYRTPRTIWNVRASRGTTSYPQAIAELPGGTNVRGLLDVIFASQFPDPAQRAAFISTFITSNGLPLFLPGPITLYANQIYLQESLSASAALIGANNNVVLTVFRLRTQPIVGSGNDTPPAIAGLTDNTQTGASTSWTHSLGGRVTLVVGADALQTRANPPFTGTTRQGTLQGTITNSITPNTSAYAGARYSRLRSDVTNDYNEAAIFFGVNHSFR